MDNLIKVPFIHVNMEPQYLSLDPTIETIQPVNARQAVDLWLELYPQEAIAHMLRPVTYILGTYYYKVQPTIIERVHTCNTGGRVFVDFVCFKDFILTISDECVCKHPNEEAFYEGSPDCDCQMFNKPMDLSPTFEKYWYTNSDPIEQAWIKCIGIKGSLVEIELHSGECILVQNGSYTVSQKAIL